MRRKKIVTPLGWQIKQRLAELRMNQKEFCRRYRIPESRLSNLISGTRPARRYRRMVAEILGIPDADGEEDGEAEPSGPAHAGAETGIS